MRRGWGYCDRQSLLSDLMSELSGGSYVKFCGQLRTVRHDAPMELPTPSVASSSGTVLMW
jgi:hypothetical protein